MYINSIADHIMSLTFLTPSKTNMRKTNSQSSLCSITTITSKTGCSEQLSPLSQTNDQDKIRIDFKSLFLEAKNYNKYLEDMKDELSQITEINDDMIQFNTMYKHATTLYENIKKEWFWISNNDIKRLFYYGYDQDDHKQIFSENYELLKMIAYKYNYKKNKQTKILYQ